MKADNWMLTLPMRMQPLHHRSTVIAFSSCLMVACLTLAVQASPPQTNVPPGKTPSKTAASSKIPESANLGKISVTATRQLIKTLQTVKVALKASYSDSPDQANAVVCRIRTGHGYLNTQERMGAVLECGTNSWFTWRRESCQNGDCLAEGKVSAYKRKGAWHSTRVLNFKQLVALRKLLKTLPPPGKGQVVVVDKSGKPVMQIKN